MKKPLLALVIVGVLFFLYSRENQKPIDKEKGESEKTIPTLPYPSAKEGSLENKKPRKQDKNKTTPSAEERRRSFLKLLQDEKGLADSVRRISLRGPIRARHGLRFELLFDGIPMLSQVVEFREENGRWKRVNADFLKTLKSPQAFPSYNGDLIRNAVSESFQNRPECQLSFLGEASEMWLRVNNDELKAVVGIELRYLCEKSAERMHERWIFDPETNAKLRSIRLGKLH